MLKRMSLILLIIFFAIQFIRPSKNVHPEKNNNLKNDISSIYSVPENVKNILKASCYDCHSNNTYYPWYSNIQPFGLWMQFHVDEGKLELNFNEFATYNTKKQNKKLEEILDEIKADNMPLSSYVIIHTEAKLTQEEKFILTDWITSIQSIIEKANVH